MFQSLGFRPDLVLEQLPFLAEALRSILSQHGNLSRCVRQTMTQAGTDPVDGGTDERVRRPHERLE